MMLIVGFEIHPRDICVPSDTGQWFTLAPWVPSCFPGDVQKRLREDRSAVMNNYFDLSKFDAAQPLQWYSFVEELIVDHEKNIFPNGEVGLFNAQQKTFFGVFESDEQDTIDVDPARINDMKARVTLQAKTIGLVGTVKCIVYGAE